MKTFNLHLAIHIIRFINSDDLFILSDPQLRYSKISLIFKVINVYTQRQLALFVNEMIWIGRNG